VPAPDGYAFRPLSLDHAPALAAAYERNRAHLARWDPVRPETYYTEAGQRAVITEQLEAQERWLCSVYVVLGPDGSVVGRANIQNIVRGAMWGGVLGYWIDVDHTRRGLATAAVEFLEGEGLRLGLHRLEAGTMVENVASQGVLRARGFERFGLVPQFLYLNGAWRDHVLFQKLLHDDPPPTPGAPAPPTAR
jgi:[ribosomal protein S5]-alanine N-acetyltransferase